VSRRQQFLSSSFSVFIRSTKWGLPAWFAHYTSWSRNWALLVHSEDMKKNPYGELERLLSFLIMGLPPATLEQAIDRASASKVQKMDMKAPGAQEHARIVRSTGVNQWQDYFDEQDLAYYRATAATFNYVQASGAA
jgi:hypothetical protein